MFTKYSDHNNLERFFVKQLGKLKDIPEDDISSEEENTEEKQQLWQGKNQVQKSQEVKELCQFIVQRQE